MAARAQAWLMVVCASGLLLSGCSPAPVTSTDDSPPSSSPTPSSPAVTVLDEDVLLAISATATAANGSEVQLNMQVHRALAWDDPEAAPLAALMTSGCEGALDASVYAANLWSFLEVDIDAKSTDGSAEWPGEQRLNLFPIHTTDLVLASSGAIATNDDVDPATPYCARDRYLNGPGESLLVAGLQGDTAETNAAGHFRRWANNSYGFRSDATTVLSECSFLLTDAGKELGGGAAWWSEQVDGSSCVIGGTP